jgi:peptidoglycan/xylan/chitin deacetylase (PgdA/CDA1 family)
MEYVLSNTHSGSIILLHPMYAWTGNQSLEILDELIDKLKQKGFSFVTIDELLKQSNTKISFR